MGFQFPLQSNKNMILKRGTIHCLDDYTPHAMLKWNTIHTNCKTYPLGHTSSSCRTESYKIYIIDTQSNLLVARKDNETLNPNGTYLSNEHKLGLATNRTPWGPALVSSHFIPLCTISASSFLCRVPLQASRITITNTIATSTIHGYSST